MSFDLRFSAEQLALKASARAFARETLSTVAAGLLQDALALPLFDGGNMGVRRRQLHELLRSANFE